MQDREGFAEIVGVDIGASHHRVVAEPGHRHKTDLALAEWVHEQPATEKARCEVAFEILAQLAAGAFDDGRAKPDARPSRRVALVQQHCHPLLVDARQARNRALFPGVPGCGVRLRLRRRRARRRAPVEPEALLGSPRVAIGGTRRPVEVVLEGSADGGIESSKRRLQANQPVDRSRRFVALKVRWWRRATLGLSQVGPERRVPLHDGQHQADKRGEGRADAPNRVQTRDFALHGDRE